MQYRQSTFKTKTLTSNNNQPVFSMDLEIHPSTRVGSIVLGHTLYETMRVLESRGLSDGNADNTANSAARYGLSQDQSTRSKANSDSSINEGANCAENNVWKPAVEFKYNQKMNIIILHLTQAGINLIFDEPSQRLLLIEIQLDDQGRAITDNGSFPAVRYQYKNEIIDQFTFTSIYNRYFGPTHDGYHDHTKNFYFLSYPGVTFKLAGVSSELSNNGSLSTAKINYSCKSIYVHHNVKKDLEPLSWDIFTSTLSDLLYADKTLSYFDKLDVITPCRSFFSQKIRYAIVNVGASTEDNTIDFRFCKHPSDKLIHRVQVGVTTMQEMIEIMGFPEDSIFKRKSRSKNIEMRKLYTVNGSASVGGFSLSTSRAFYPSTLLSKIRNINGIMINTGNNDHDHDKINPYEYFTHCEQEMIKIHNYFSLGIDVIYDLTASDNGSNVVSRIIVHQNNIESTDFLKYEKLVLFSTERLYPNDSEVPDADGPPYLFDRLFKSVQAPIFIDRKEYNVQEDFERSLKETDRNFEFIDVANLNIDETSERNGDSDKEDANLDLRHWGLSKYNGEKWVVVESLVKTDKICNMTLL